MAYVINDDCISCGACAAGCPVEAISEGAAHYEINADVCVDCGACAGTCPVSGRSTTVTVPLEEADAQAVTATPSTIEAKSPLVLFFFISSILFSFRLFQLSLHCFKTHIVKVQQHFLSYSPIKAIAYNSIKEYTGNDLAKRICLYSFRSRRLH